MSCDELGRRAYLKPVRQDRGDFRSRAAREKITSDIAHELGLTVPPVLLTERGDAPSGEERFVCVSLVMRSVQWPWSLVKGFVEEPGRDPEAAKMVMEILPVATAHGFVFDWWVGQPDHNDHPHNVIFGSHRDGTGATFIFLDYAFALGFGGTWHFENPVTSAPYPPLMLKHLDPPSVAAMAAKVQTFPDDVLEDIVCRIPGSHMQENDKDFVLAGLKRRRKLVEAAVAL